MGAKKILKVGDKVMWRGSWGKEIPKEVKITSIELCAVGEKYGKNINTCDWETVRKGKVVVDLDNGHWAYGTQLDPIENN